jgi:hypothetical protein
LLAGDGVEQALEDTREAGRLEAPVALGELVEQTIAGDARVEAGEIEVESEEPCQRRARGSLGETRHVAACHDDLEPRRARGSDLGHRQFQGLAVDEQRTAVRPSVPRVDCVLLPSAERPDGEVESERGSRPKLEPTLRESPRMDGCPGRQRSFLAP